MSVRRTPGIGLAALLAVHLNAVAGSSSHAETGIEAPADRSVRLVGSRNGGAQAARALGPAFFAHHGVQGLKWQAKGVRAVLERPGAPKTGPLLFSILSTSPGGVFARLGDGAADIGVVVRQILKEEREAHKTIDSDWLSPMSEHVIGLTALALVVHPENPVQSLKPSQIADIFNGATTNWAEVGGPDQEISVYALPRRTSVRRILHWSILRSAPLTDNAKVIAEGEAMIARILSDPGGIGIVSLGATGRTRPVAVTECGLSLPPSPFIAKTEEYPLTRRLYAYAPQERRSTAVQDFVAFAKGAAGQQALGAGGFINLEIEAAEPKGAYVSRKMDNARRLAQNAETVDRLVRATASARQLSSVIRFRAGASRPDSRAINDLERIVRYVGANFPDHRIRVLGFADNRGDYNQNVRLSEKRAKSIAGLLRTQGLRIEAAIGFGEEAPVACNKGSGYGRNRRVEIWIAEPSARIK